MMIDIFAKSCVLRWEQQGFQVHEAENGKQALKLFAELAPDLLVLDIIMPEEDGFAVCREIRRTSEVPILFLSSRDDEIDRVCGLELGADDYIVKPFSPRELVARVRANLRRTTKEKKAGRWHLSLLAHCSLTRIVIAAPGKVTM